VSFSATEILFAATARCSRCDAGMAYPLDPEQAHRLRGWMCSAVLTGTLHALGHDVLPFVFWKVREETSINNGGGHTTRPAGTVARTVGTATCEACKHMWESEPYSACGAGHHWFGGPCPKCGNAVGANGSWAADDGPRVSVRYRDVVLPDHKEPA
jgi:hypothetical protein